jgi:NO-binding membrane sensor protein with MHYT domain
MDFNLAKLLYEENSFGVFLLLSVILGGGAAYLSGRAIAGTWRPLWQVTAYMLVLGLAVRFLHFALFEGTLLSPHYYLVDTAICIGFGWLGFKATRAGQMATQYGWLYQRSGWLEWRPRAGPNAAKKSG